MVKDCVRYDGRIKDIHLSGSRVSIKLAAATRKQVASMGKLAEEAVVEKYKGLVEIAGSVDALAGRKRNEFALLKKGSQLSVFISIDEDNKEYVQLQL